MASYPTAVKGFTVKAAGATIQQADVNDLQDEVTALETQLLTTGSWTPTIASSGGGAPTYSVQVGRYVKVGNLITVMGTVTLATKGTLGVGTVTIAGLPVASVNTANLSASIVISSYLLTTAVVWVVGNITPGASAIQVVQNAAASASGSNTTVADLAATSTFSFSGTYFTA